MKLFLYQKYNEIFTKVIFLIPEWGSGSLKIINILYFVSNNIRWRQAFKFATCRSCRGVGGYVARTVMLQRELKNMSLTSEKRNDKFEIYDNQNSEKNSVTTTEEDKNLNPYKKRNSSNQPYQSPAAVRRQADSMIEIKNNEKHKSLWRVPDFLSVFLCNLPFSSSAVNPDKLPLTVRKAYQLLNLKLCHDLDDIRKGLWVEVWNSIRNLDRLSYFTYITIFHFLFLS